MRRIVPLLGLAALLLVTGARPQVKPSRQSDTPARTAAPRLKAACPAKTRAGVIQRAAPPKAMTARATSRPTRLDPLMAL